MLKKEISQRKATLQLNIPGQTLRDDRLTGKVDTECVTTGRAPIVSLEEEEKLCNMSKLWHHMGMDKRGRMSPIKQLTTRIPLTENLGMKSLY